MINSSIKKKMFKLFKLYDSGKISCQEWVKRCGNISLFKIGEFRKQYEKENSK